MKSVLVSIRPKWCELIADGKKTIEIRKNRPKLETPFKCYIYCTKDKHGWFDFLREVSLDGKVIGEFVCRRIDKISHCGTSNNDIKLRIVDNFYYKEIGYEYLLKCRLTYSDLEKYSNGGDIYGWHISDLKIYDKPKELSEFGLTRPPQSWCYVDIKGEK